MARADLLLKFVKAGTYGDNTLFRKIVESIIAEEKSKQHHTVAQQLLDALPKASKPQSNQPIHNRLLKDGLEDGLDSFLYRMYPQTTLDNVI